MQQGEYTAKNKILIILNIICLLHCSSCLSSTN